MELPVSGLKVLFRVPDGNDDVAILEAAGEAVERALAVLPRLAKVAEYVSGAVPSPDNSRELWAALTVTDFETALLGLRRFLFGDRVACVFRDNSHGCGERMELEFSILAFLADVHPAVRPGVELCDGDAHWFRLTGKAGQGVRFRLPQVQDQVDVLGQPGASALLAERCIRSIGPNARVSARTIAHAERAMEAMAPPVSRPLTGNCPECGQPVTISLHVPRLVMDELEVSAAGVHEEIDAIAAAYHWDEAAILAMPQRRRRTYAETIRRRERVVV